jgi:hypothetical protein
VANTEDRRQRTQGQLAAGSRQRAECRKGEPVESSQAVESGRDADSTKGLDGRSDRSCDGAGAR